MESELWWAGPEFPAKPASCWPKHAVPAAPHLNLSTAPLLEQMIGSFVSAGRPGPSADKSPFVNLSEWASAVRAADFISRMFARKLRVLRGEEGEQAQPLPSANHARPIEMEQRALWPLKLDAVRNERRLPAKHPWRVLNVSYSGGLIVAAGRDGGAALPILGKQSWLARLWVWHVHQYQLQHIGGPRTLLAAARRRIWILGGVALARAAVRNCTTCKKAEPTRFKPIEGPLLPERLGTAAEQGIFTHVLVNHCGPFYTRQGQGRPAEKRWIFVITCAGIRAVHFELVKSRSTKQTAAAMVRFTARRGVPALVVSDNAPELVAAGAALRSAAASAADPGGKRTWADREWRTYSVHFGGAVEAVVKLCKRALSKVVEERNLHDLDLAHQLVVSEFIVNGRPIGALSQDVRDPTPVTCNDILCAGKSSLVLHGPALGSGRQASTSRGRPTSRARGGRRLLPSPLSSRSAASGPATGARPLWETW